MQKIDLITRDSEDKKLFQEVFDNFTKRFKGLSMDGTLVCYNGDIKFNTKGYNLPYNLYQLTKMLDEVGEFA